MIRSFLVSLILTISSSATAATIQATLLSVKKDMAVVQIGKAKMNVHVANIIYPEKKKLITGATVVVKVAPDDFKIVIKK